MKYATLLGLISASIGVILALTGAAFVDPAVLVGIGTVLVAVGSLTGT